MPSTHSESELYVKNGSFSNRGNALATPAPVSSSVVGLVG